MKNPTKPKKSKEQRLSISPSLLDGTIPLKKSRISGPSTQEAATNSLVLEYQNELLGMITQGLPTKTMLENLILLFERRFPGAFCSLLLLEDDGIHIRHGAGPHLPADYLKSIDGLPIGPSTGSCGTAMYTKTPVFVSDISQDPLWENYKTLALQHDLRSCGSVPILGTDTQALGALAVYYHEPHEFLDEECNILKLLSDIAAIAIQNSFREEDLKLFKHALEASTDAIVITCSQLDLPGPKILFANRAFSKMTGYSQEEVLGRTPRILQGPKTDRKVLTQLRADLSSGKDFHGETINYRKDGTEFDLEWSISSIRSEDGELTNYLSIQHDVTEQKFRQKESTWLLQKAQASTRLTYTAQKRIELLHHVSTSLLEMPSEPITRMEHLTSILVPEFADGCVIHLMKSLDETHPVIMSHKDKNKVILARKVNELFPHTFKLDEGLRIFMANKKAKLIPSVSDDLLYQFSRNAKHFDFMKSMNIKSLMAIPILLQEELMGLILLVKTESQDSFSPEDLALAQDIADRCAMALGHAERLQDAQSAIQQREALMAILSHDLKNPLSSILLCAQASLAKIPKDQEWAVLRKYATNILTSARQMNELIHNILSLETDRSQAPPLESENLNELCTIIDEVTEMLDPIAKNKNLQITKRIPNGKFFLHCSRNEIDQVLSNLLGNSIKFTPSGGAIEIALELKLTNGQQQAQISVKDNGPGIPKEELEFMFKRGWRSRTSDQKPGTGLGLYIVQNIIEKRHGGRVWAESQNPVGTTIYCTLPKVTTSSTNNLVAL